MQVLAAVIKAGASREHEILAEIRDVVFSFILKMEPKGVMDTMLVSRVRILYIRSLLARSPELQSIKVSSHALNCTVLSPSKRLDHKLSSRSNGKAKHRSDINGGFFLYCSPARKIQAAGAGEGEERGERERERAPKPVFGAGSSFTIHRFRDRKDDVTTEDDDVPVVTASSRFAFSLSRQRWKPDPTDLKMRRRR
ncbi:hypothetical protein U1Q18_002105 [Sarracenia purpurea var. burkii]